MSEGGGALKGFLVLAAGYMIASIVLQALILSRGLNGSFMPRNWIASSATSTMEGTTPVQPTFPFQPNTVPPEPSAPLFSSDVIMEQADPTTAPVATSTDAPLAPVATPTAAPLAPVATPTAAPIAEPLIFNPSQVEGSAVVRAAGGSPPVTTGVCEVSTSFQGEGSYLQDACRFIAGSNNVETNQMRYDSGCFPVGVPSWHPENNILLTYPDPDACALAVSPTWTVSGWNHTFIQLASGEVFNPPVPADDEMMAVKLIRGTLLDINTNGILRNDGRWETYVVTPPNRAASLWLSSAITDIEAGENGAAFVFYKVTKDHLNMFVTDMSASPVIDNAGPFSENLEWVQFGNYYGAFAQVEFYNYAGMLLNNYDGSRLGYFQWWTFREDEDADGYHDHSGLNTDNTFAELHVNLYPSSGTSGMQTTLPNTLNELSEANPSFIDDADLHKYGNNDQTEVQISIPLAPGYVHGPLWSVNADTGQPSVGCNGGVLYPFHRWLGGAGNGRLGYHAPPRYSLWMALEHPPQYATIPRTMLATWINAYLQSEMDTPDCV